VAIFGAESCKILQISREVTAGWSAYISRFTALDMFIVQPLLLNHYLFAIHCSHTIHHVYHGHSPAKRPSI
jgi:hypothetical protein